jgi:hypothetical protein
MTRGRHHNLACVITEPAGDEHTRHPAPTPGEVLAGALRRTSAEKSATETLRDELEQLQPQIADQARAAIIEGLRQAQQHSYQHTIPRQARRPANPFPGHSPPPASSEAGPNCEPTPAAFCRHILRRQTRRRASASLSLCGSHGFGGRVGLPLQTGCYKGERCYVDSPRNEGPG